MTNLRHYYLAPLSAFESLANLRWAAVDIPQGSFGWVLWADDPTQQSAFETKATHSFKTLLHPSIPVQAATALAAHGIAATDSVFAVAEKIWTKFAGFTMEI